MNLLRQHKIPVTILTGFLGAGKTTLLNRILNEDSQQKTAVIVNEYGDLSIDSQLITDTKEEIIEINSGCICCNVRGDLISILSSMLRQQLNGEVQFDRVIIETTGLANPAPVVQTFLMDEAMSRWFELDSVCTVLDSKHLPQHIDSEELQEQIAFADVLIFNKTDLVNERELKKLQTRITQMNPNANVIHSINCDINTSDIIGIQSFDLGHKLQIHPNLLTDEHHHHHDTVNSFVFTDDRPLNLDRVNRWFSYLVQIKGESLYRYKGILHIDGMDERVVFQGVHMLFSGTKDRTWLPAETKQSEIVFIGKELDKYELEKGFYACLQ